MKKSGFRLRGRFRVHRYDAFGNFICAMRFYNAINSPVLDELMNAFFRNATQPTNWYTGLIDNASFVSVSSADLAESHTGWIENQDYDESTRVEWTPPAAASQKLENTLSMDFTMNAVKTIQGLFLSENSTKGDATVGQALWCTGLFDTPQSLGIGEVLKVFYDLTAREG